VTATNGDLIAFERLNPPVAWSTSEIEKLMHLRTQLGWDFSAIAIELGRTESGVKSKYKYVLNDRLIKAPALPGVRDPVPQQVLAEQARRLTAPARDLTGAVFGDPPSGWSALDRRTA
jgi:hypothetical protein